MRTYQRLVIAKGGSKLSTDNPAYPHNFLVYNSATGVLKIGSTGVRYNSLPEVGKTGAGMVSPTSNVPVDDEETAPNVETMVSWPVKKKRQPRKKLEIQADDVATTD